MISLFNCKNDGKSTSETATEHPKVFSTPVKESTPTTETVTIENVEWKLTMLDGEKVHNLKETDHDIHFVLHTNGNRVSGFSGCNTFMGSYSLDGGNRITFSNLASTKKACPVAAIDESELLNILEMTENFTISDGNLVLNTKKIPSLAVFETGNHL